LVTGIHSIVRPRPKTLAQWLAWQESLHPKPIDLGLERPRQVARRLDLLRPDHAVITVGGTNGKGSCVAFLEAMLRAGGYRVGAYTSPHLRRYNERIRVDGVEIDDTALCRAFGRIDAVRGEVSLTFFEFGTLAAFEIFHRAAVDVAVVEVGLGGRLDAVNCLDADAAVVTAVDLDHQEWLGSDRDSIGREKAGIYRTGRPAICADPEPPKSLLEYADTLGAELYLIGSDYDFRVEEGIWRWWHGQRELTGLPIPALLGAHQLRNAAAALMALTTLSKRLPLSFEAIRQGLIGARLSARFQVVPGAVERILDVAHNPQGAATLARCLRERACAGRTFAVLGMLSDKDVVGVVRAMADIVDHWCTVSLDVPRGLSGERLARKLHQARIFDVTPRDRVSEAVQFAEEEAAPGDRIVVFGSFYTAADALELGFDLSDRQCQEGG
jgi:dihydrofolate synthase/folylpolyglutamate synthase